MGNSFSLRDTKCFDIFYENGGTSYRCGATTAYTNTTVILKRPTSETESYTLALPSAFGLKPTDINPPLVLLIG